MNITFEPTGVVRCLYTEEIDLRSIGHMKIERNTSVEFDEHSQEWLVKAEAGGELLFRHASRNECLIWEVINL